MTSLKTTSNDNLDQNNQSQEQQDQTIILAFQKQIEQLKKDKEKADIEFIRFQTENAQLEKEETEINNRLKELQTLIQNMKVEQTKLDEEIKELEKQKADLEDQLDQQQQILKQNQEHLEEIKQQLNRLKEKLEEFQEEKDQLEEQRTNLEREKQEIEQKLNDLQLQIKQLEQEIKATIERLRVIELEIQRIQNELHQIQEDIQRNEWELQKTEKRIAQIQDQISKLQEECDRIDQEIQIISDRINKIERIIDMKQHHKEEYEQLKKELLNESQQLKQQDVQIQHQIKQFEQQIQQIQPLDQELQQIDNSLRQHEHELNKINADAQQLKQNTDRGQHEFLQLKQQEQQISKQLQMKQDECKSIEKDKQLFQEQYAHLEKDLTIIKTNQAQIEIDRNLCHEELQREKQKYKQCENNLKNAQKEQQIAQVELHQQEQKEEAARQHLQICQEKESIYARARVQAEEHEKWAQSKLQMSEHQLESAKSLSNVSGIDLLSLGMVGSFVPVAIIGAQSLSPIWLATIDRNKEDLILRQQVREKCVHDHKESIINRGKAFTSLEVEKANIETRRKNLASRNYELEVAKKSKNKEKSLLDNTDQRYSDLQHQFDNGKKKVNDFERKLKETETKQFNCQQRLAAAKTSIDNLISEKNDLNCRSQQVQNEVQNNQVQYQTKTNEKNEKNMEIKQMKETKNRLKVQTRQKRAEIIFIQTQIKTKRNQQQVIKGEIDNVEQALLMISKSIIDLQSDLREQKKLLDEATKQKTKYEIEINSLKSKIEKYDNDLERLESDRPRLDQELQNKNQVLAEIQNENDRFYYYEKQQQYEINHRISEVQHYERTKLQVVSALDENKNIYKEVENNIKELNKQIEKTKNIEKQMAEEQFNESQRGINSKKSDIANLKKHATAKKQDYEKSREKQIKSQEELDNLQKRKNNHDRQIMETKRNLNTQVLNIQQLSSKIGQAENELWENQQHRQDPTTKNTTLELNPNIIEVQKSTNATNTAQTPSEDIFMKSHRYSPHATVTRDENCINRIVVQTISSCCIDLLGLTLTDNSACVIGESTSNEMINLKRDVPTEIVCLYVDPSSIKPTSEIYSECKSFSNDLKCVSYVLSKKPMEAKHLIYFIVSAIKAKFIVPLIHSHSCVERIYVHDTTDDSQNSGWTTNYSKLSGSWSSFDQIQEQLTKDIVSMVTRPSRWARSQELLIKLCTQHSSYTDKSFTINVGEQKVEIPQIITLFCGGYQRFQLSLNGIEFSKFDDIQRCLNRITEIETSSIFLVICGASIDNSMAMRSLIDHPSVHAAYIFLNVDERHLFQMNPLWKSSKISGIFVYHNELLVQLATDICFYRQISNNIPKMSLLRTNSEVLAQLEVYEKEFLRYQLFMDILPQLLSSTSAGSEMTKSIEITDPTLRIIELAQKINNLFRKYDLRTILQSKFQVLHTNRDIQSLPSDILRTSLTVYRTQIISDDDLGLIRKNPTALFSLLSHIIASQSYPSVIEICRQAIDNGLKMVLFEMKLFKGTTVKRILANPDLIVFPLGTIFRLKSIEQMPDNAWYIQAELSDFDLQCFKDQLQFEIGKDLTLLTISDYLMVLDQLETNNESDQ